MARLPRISIQTAVLVLVSFFLVVTFSLGGLSGFTSGIGTTLPWLVAIFGGIYEAFEKRINTDQIGNLRLGGVVAAIFVTALIPISWHSIYGFPTSAMLAALSVLGYVLYGTYLASNAVNTKDVIKKRSSHKTHSILLTLNLPFLFLQ